jgi:Transposase DDE domain
MCPPQYTITAKDLHCQAAQLLRRHLQLRDHGPKCTAQTVLLVLVYAAARLISLAAACAALRDAPSDQAIRDALRATLPPLYDLQDCLNHALAGRLPKALRRRRQPVAIDLTLVPYHGQHLYDPDEIYRGQAKSGTTHFHAYATLYVIRHGQRYTVALDYVLRGEALEDVVRGLLQQAAKAGLTPRYVLLDRGFFSVGVLRYLQAARYPMLMPVPCRGRKATHPRGPGGTRLFHRRTRSGWDRYTVRNAEGRTATVGICIKCRNYRGQWRRHGRQTLVYAYWGLQPSSAQWVYTTYRLRFGIETSYRQLRQAKIVTSTRDPVLRLLFVGLALVLRNEWVWLHWEVLAHPHRGGRRLDLDQLPFRQMLSWLAQLAQTLLGFCEETQADHPMPT